jgi:hypothetical protein
MTCAIWPKRRIFIGCPACDWVHGHDLRELFDQRAIVASRDDWPLTVARWPLSDWGRSTLVRSLSYFFLAREDDNLHGMKELTEAEIAAACEAWTRVWRRAVVAQQLGTHPFRLRDAIQEAYQAIMRVREATTHQTETSSPRRSHRNLRSAVTKKRGSTEM